MYHEFPDLWKDLLRAGLKDDGWPWDWTTLGTRNDKTQSLKAKVIAKSNGVWAAEKLVKTLSQISSTIQAESRILDGKRFKAGDVLVDMKGLSSEVLALERPFLNLAAYVSGIATTTSRIVEKVKNACPKNTPRVTLTRKTLPGYRDVAIHGVRVGGGYPHRVSLSGGILIKENHIAAAGSILKAVRGVRAVAPHGLKIEIEVRSSQELKEALEADADGVLLDNFSPAGVQSAVKLLSKHPRRPFVEISGGLNEANISDYTIQGVDILSVGALTHSVKVVDLSLLVDG